MDEKGTRNEVGDTNEEETKLEAEISSGEVTEHLGAECQWLDTIEK